MAKAKSEESIEVVKNRNRAGAEAGGSLTHPRSSPRLEPLGVVSIGPGKPGPPHLGKCSMPMSSPRPCRRCRTGLTRERHGYCPACRTAVYREQDAQRGSAHSRGYTRRWQTESRRFLAAHPLCRECHEAGQVTTATVVDHIVPHRGDAQLFWDRDNWQPLCKRHHDAKTARGEAFGRTTSSLRQDD